MDSKFKAFAILQERDCFVIQAGKDRESVSHSAVSNSLQPQGLQPARLLRPWDFPGKNTGVGSHFLLQGIFPTQGSNPCLPHCRQTLYCLSHQGSSEKTLVYFYGSCLYYSSLLGTPHHTTPGLLTRNKGKVL